MGIEALDDMLYILPLLSASVVDDEFGKNMLLEEMDNNPAELKRYVDGLTLFTQLLLLEIAIENDTTPLEIIADYSVQFNMHDPNKEL